jgi:hypothetical protein
LDKNSHRTKEIGVGVFEKNIVSSPWFVIHFGEDKLEY